MRRTIHILLILVDYAADAMLGSRCMIDHIRLTISNYARGKKFFEEALSPLGYSVLIDHEISGGGFGRDGKPDFWIKGGELNSRIHVAFSSPNRATVDAFYEAAISAGGTCNGPPGPRPEYHPSYYGAFVLDPDGNNVEAVCHSPE
jgi:catechol 2,3-dioxygenase-like lactoylglutathione lyase family enzyme